MPFGYGAGTFLIAEGRALFDVTAAPKQWSEYPCGHDIDANIEARADRADFVFA
ncbi:MAG: hypothetical protein ACR2M5_02110 [Nakamurella sp.]